MSRTRPWPSRGADETPISQILTPLLTGQRRRLVLISLSSMAGGFAEAGVLVLIARIAFALAEGDGSRSGVSVHLGQLDQTVSVPLVLALTMALIGVRLLLNVTQAHLSARTLTAVLSAIRKSLVYRYLEASWSLQIDERGGRLQELLTTYANRASTAVLSLSQGLAAGFNLLAFVLTALVVNPAASILVVTMAVLLALLLQPIRAAVGRRSRRAADTNLAFATSLTELASTTQEIRVFEVEDQVRRRLGTLADLSSDRLYRTNSLSQMSPAVYQAMALVLVVVALAVTYAVTFSGLASLGAIILITLRSLTYGQIVQSSIQTLHESAPYLEDLRSEENRYHAAAISRAGQPVTGVAELVFDGVSFEYEPGRPVLTDVSFRVRRGEIIGIIGPSGAGKSTLVQLLLRLRDPTGGRILADGHDVRELSLTDWYDHVTFVPQEARLFAGTIAENIRFFREGIEDVTVQGAARRSHLHDDVASWPLGYETPIGENGGHLSGGQRQRLCIARALVEHPDIVVLDEPTSSLDARSEALMRESISELLPHTTVFIVAHRLSTLSICSRIMVLQNGSLESFDEPSELEKNNRFFRDVLKLSGMRG